MEFQIGELLKFGVAGGLIIFMLLRLFSFLEKLQTIRANGNGSIDRAMLKELKNFMANLNRQIEEHAKESRVNFQRVEDKIERKN